MSNIEHGPILVLVGCGAAKVQRRASAGELYSGSLTRAAVAYGRKIGHAAIVSARYGAIGLDREIDPYDQRIEQLRGGELLAWQHRVASQLVQLGDEAKRAGLGDGPLLVVLLLGASYRRALQAPLRAFDDLRAWRGEPTTRVVAPLEGLQLGERLRWFAQRRPLLMTRPEALRAELQQLGAAPCVLCDGTHDERAQGPCSGCG